MINVLMFIEHHREKKYGLTTVYPNSHVSYLLFKYKLVNDFILNLAMVFAFFNFITTLVIVGY
jgi:hypothetical protein